MRSQYALPICDQGCQERSECNSWRSYADSTNAKISSGEHSALVNPGLQAKRKRWFARWCGLQGDISLRLRSESNQPLYFRQCGHLKPRRSSEHGQREQCSCTMLQGHTSSERAASMRLMRQRKMTKEQRRNPRVECTGSAGVLMAAGELPRPAKIVNLSMGGCLLVLKDPQCLQQDSIVELTFEINDLMFRALGQVKSKRSDTTIGFQFPLPNDRLRRRLEALIERLIGNLPTKSSLRGPGERRQAPRLECTGPATVQMAAGEPFCEATIANLSAGGCMMVLRRPQLFSQDMLVELTFSVNHLPFRVRGQVRTIRSDTAIGFQFPQLSERVRKHLEDLMKELMENILKRQAIRGKSSPDDCR